MSYSLFYFKPNVLELRAWGIIIIKKKCSCLGWTDNLLYCLYSEQFLYITHHIHSHTLHCLCLCITHTSHMFSTRVNWCERICDECESSPVHSLSLLLWSCDFLWSVTDKSREWTAALKCVYNAQSVHCDQHTHIHTHAWGRSIIVVFMRLAWRGLQGLWFNGSKRVLMTWPPGCQPPHTQSHRESKDPS